MTPQDYIPAGPDAPVIDSGEAAAAWWRNQVMTLPQFRPEVEWTSTLFLDGARRLLGHLAPTSDGARAWVRTSLRKALRSVLQSGAVSLVHLHSHPQGATTQPSEDDRDIFSQLAVWLGQIGASVSDVVIVSAAGDEWYSFAEEGELKARKDAKHDVQASSDEAAFRGVLEFLNRHDPRVQPLVSELANNVDISQEQWLADFVHAAIVEKFSPPTIDDGRLCYVGAFFQKYPDLLMPVSDAAKAAGVGFTQFIWDGSQAAFAKGFGGPEIQQKSA